MPKIETNEDLKKYIYGLSDHLYKIKVYAGGYLVWRRVVLAKSGNYIFMPHSYWQSLGVVDLSVYENRIYCKANKRVKIPNPIFAKIKQMSDRFEKRKQNETSFI